MDYSVGLFVFLASVMLSMTLIPVLVKVAPKLGLIDHPNARKIHGTGIPQVGGIAIFVASLVPLFIWLPKTALAVPIFTGLSLLFLFGVLDDRYDLSYKLKFIGQISAASVVVYFGDVFIVRYPFFEGYEIPVEFSKVITVVCLVGITNAINLSDGLDGLAAGTSLLVIACMMAIAYFSEDLIIFFFSLAVVGATIGFLRFNSHPALIFMGDSGSQFLGFCAGIIVVVISQKSNAALSPMLPVMLLGLPVLDTLFVMLKRVYEGRSPFSADRSHIHHRFLQIGFSHHSAVILIYVAQILLVITAYQLRYASDFIVLIAYLFFCISLLLITSTHFTFPKKPIYFISHAVDFTDFNKNNHVRRSLFKVASVLLGGVFVIAPLCVDDVTSDFGLAALIMFFCVVVSVFIKTKISLVIVRVCLFSIAMFSVYFIEISPVGSAPDRSLFNIYFFVLGLIIAVIIRFWHKDKFGFSGLDFLTVSAAVIIPLVIDVSMVGIFGGFVVLEVLILLYSIDVLFDRVRWVDWVVIFGALISCVLIFYKSFI